MSAIQQQEQLLVSALKQNGKEAFSILFKLYYRDLVLFGGNFIPEKTACEDIVQTVFMKLWNDRNQLNIEISLKSYLLKAVRNTCLDELRHREIVRSYQSITVNDCLENYDTENYILYSNLNDHFQEALLKLPPKYREAFEMNRISGLKYKEIAAELNVSERTIEVRVGKALHLLRELLKDFLVLFWAFLFLK